MGDVGDRPLYYILDENHLALPVFDVLEWAKWFEGANRHVADEMVGEYRVSTVFLAIDHSYGGGDPVLFETMVFHERESFDEMDRYHTWAEALAGHARIKAGVEAMLAQAKEVTRDTMLAFMETHPKETDDGRG